MEEEEEEEEVEQEEEGNTQQDILVLASMDTTLAKFEDTLNISAVEVLPL